MNLLAFVDDAAESGGVFLLHEAGLLDVAVSHASAAGTKVLHLTGADFGGQLGDLADAHRALARLTAAAADGPLLVVVDDVQWTTAKVLQFVARRVTGTRIGLLVVTREPGDAHDLPASPELLEIAETTFGDPARSTQAVLDRLDALLSDLAHETSPTRIVRAGAAAMYVDRLPVCREPLHRVARRGPAAKAAEARLLLATDAFQTGQWDEAGDSSRYLRALVAAARGETTEKGLVQHQAWHVEALEALGRRDFETAYRCTASITPPGTFTPHAPQALWTILDLVESAENSGRHAEARAHALAAREIGAISPRLTFVGRVAEAMTSEPGQFTEALAAPGLERWPFELARADLYFGERLRRDRDLVAARRHLAAALERFERLGAQPWVARARGELRATGARSDQPRPAVVLTAQQHHIATLAAAGLTNKQIGAQLFLSPRTVGAHLYQLFPKLGVTSRAALRDALTELDAQSFD
ncbi:helix-turn-helix transcriptional regulator [Lentzea sp. BCCO 10_0856]|uniref:Helix-turn-helix transcriptional regulator n=1 Tax=Lentzea miocenica TaxID=3095431 RepID=A0ABU4T395_9PSEU|nr:helix-turn-helix transcriptional regulator [Lentzea sp. BCCO 10_0856]MDX8032621.1 helix-turn-helix transcriptional regulator [Lentzea sp. BCCO 10_0856]